MTLKPAILAGVALLLATAVRADYTYTRDFPVRTLLGYQNLYITSFPDTIGLADVANTSAPWLDKCDLRGGPGDGVINVDDAICTFWGDGSPRIRDGRFAIQKCDTTTCLYETRAAMWMGPLGVVFVGTPFRIEPSIGYTVYVAVNDPISPMQASNTGTLRGTCAPGFPSLEVRADTCTRALIAVPDDMRPLTAAEVLCGRAGVDFPDGNGDTLPDGTPSTRICPNGIWDPVTSGATVSVFTYDSEPGNNQFPGTDGQFLIFTLSRNALGIQFQGNNYTTSPGTGLFVNPSYRNQSRTWTPPIDPTLCP